MRFHHISLSVTDVGAGSWALAGAHAGHPGSATFSYEFAWRSHALGGDPGATHAVELPFVFDNAELPRLAGEGALLGPDKPPADLAARTHRAWIRFARTGNPGWDQYDTTRRATMRIDAEWTQVDDPRGREREAWSRALGRASRSPLEGDARGTSRAVQAGRSVA